MICVSHFMDREGLVLAAVSPRRFFCTQCHVPQHETKVPVENDFVDIDTLLSRTQPGGRR
jgi:cytochrome c-type protein NapB